MCRWLKEVVDILTAIVKRMSKLMLNSRVLQSDATTLPVVKRGLGKTHKGYIWVYLDHPNVDISNNASERSIKPMVLSRNWLFAGSEEGGQTAATTMSIIETCKRLGINPFAYMKDVLSRFPSAKTSQIDDFLPDRWLALKDAESQPT